MLVSELKQHMKMIRATNLFAIVKQFNIDPELLRQQLKILIRKGCVQQRMLTLHCVKGCTRCDPLLTEIYLWVG